MFDTAQLTVCPSRQGPRRWVRRLGAGAAVLALLSGGVACSAGEGAGKEDGLRLTVPEVFYLHRPGAKGTGRSDSNRVPFQVRVDKGRERVALDQRKDQLVVEVDGQQKAVRLRKKGSPCTGDAVRVTCRVGPGYTTGADGGAIPTAVQGSKAGATATVRYRLTTADGQVRTARTRVVVGEPVLRLQRPEKITGVASGGLMTLPLAVRNVGEVTAEGIGLGIDYAPLVSRRRHGNCRYWHLLDGRRVMCRFPGLRIPPGETVTFTPTPQFDVPATRQTRSTVRAGVWLLALWPLPDSGWPTGGDPGDGAGLTPRRAAPDRTGESTLSAESTAWTTVRLDTRADYAAIGGALHGKPGTERRITVGVRNNGPGELDGRVVWTEFTVPNGSLVVEEPREPVDEDVYEPLCTHKSDYDHTWYTCSLDAPAAGRTSTVEFTVRISGSGTGRVRLLNVTAENYHDDHPDNNSAPVRVVSD